MEQLILLTFFSSILKSGRRILVLGSCRDEWEWGMLACSCQLQIAKVCHTALQLVRLYFNYTFTPTPRKDLSVKKQQLCPDVRSIHSVLVARLKLSLRFCFLHLLKDLDS